MVLVGGAFVWRHGHCGMHRARLMDIQNARQFSGRRLRVWPADIDATGRWTRRYSRGRRRWQSIVTTGCSVYIGARCWRDGGRATYTESELVSTESRRRYLIIDSAATWLLPNPPYCTTTITITRLHLQILRAIFPNSVNRSVKSSITRILKIISVFHHAFNIVQKANDLQLNII